MNSINLFTGAAARRWVRRCVLALLAAVLLAAGAYTHWIFYYIDVFLQQLVMALKLQALAALVERASHARLTMQRLPVMLLYGVLYCGLSLLTLLVYLGKGRRMLLVLLFYAGVFVLCLGFVLAANLLGGLIPVYNLARRLIEMIVSPLPVVLFLSLFGLAKNGPAKK